MVSATTWCIIFTIAVFLIPVSFMTTLMGRLIYLGCVIALGVLAFCIKLYCNSATATEDNAQEFQLAELGGGEEEMSVETRLEIASWAISSLPPVQSYEGDVHDCPICMEGLQIGSSVQSFGVCGHQFHQACLHSWLQMGKSTCPVCRLDLLV